MIFEDLLDLSPRLVGNAWPAIDDFGNSGCGYAGDFYKLAKQTVEGVLKGEGTPDEVVKKHDYKIVEDNGAIETAVDAAFEANPDVVEKLKSGNMKPMGVIIGAVMKATRGQADAKAVTKVVMSKIKG